jgi:hypothetical protein
MKQSWWDWKGKNGNELKLIIIICSMKHPLPCMQKKYSRWRVFTVPNVGLPMRLNRCGFAKLVASIIKWATRPAKLAREIVSRLLNLVVIRRLKADFSPESRLFYMLSFFAG